MKKLLVIAIIMLTSIGAFAMEPLKFGVKGGLNTGNFDFKKNKLDDTYRAFATARSGYHVGVFMRISFLGMHVQPEFLYNWNKYNMTLWTSNSNNEDISKMRVQTLEVPVLAGFNFLFLRLNAGPVFNIMNKISHSSGAVKQAEIMKPTVSFAAGVGLDILRFSLDVRYNGQFKKSSQAININDNHYDIKNNFKGWAFSLGYTF